MITKLHDSKFLKLYENDGWVFASRKDVPRAQGNFKPDAVDILVRHILNNKYVVTKQWRKSVEDFVYETPAGLIDEGETAEDAARRELHEETGLTLFQVLSTVKGLPSVGGSDEEVVVVNGIATGSVTNIHNEGDEDISVEFWNEDDIAWHIAEGYHVSLTLAMLALGVRNNVPDSCLKP